jgi:type II secretory pathway pseudopilin PulG
VTTINSDNSLPGYRDAEADRPKTSRRSGFTMLELLIVVSVIIVLISLLLPAIQQAREGARRTQCCNNLMQLGIALQNYQHCHGLLPPGCVDSEPGPLLNRPFSAGMPRYQISWRVQILPFMDDQNVHQGIDFQNPELSFLTPEEQDRLNLARASISSESARDSSTRSSISGSTIPTAGSFYSGQGIYLHAAQCPSEPLRSNFAADHPDPSRFGAITSYSGCHASTETPIDSNNDGLLYLNSSESLHEVPDGISTTLLVGETISNLPVFGWFVGDRSTLRNGGNRFEYRANRNLTATEQAESALTDEEQQRTLRLRERYVGGFGSYHSTVNLLMADGSVRPISFQVDTEVLRRLSSRNDGGAVSDDAF